MLCYWILRRPDGTPAGLVRMQNGRVTLKPTVPIAGSFTLFSASSAVPIMPETETELPGAEALLGMEGDRMTCFAAADTAASAATYRKRISRFYTTQAEKPLKKDAPSRDEPIMSHVKENNLQTEPEPARQLNDMSQINTIKSDSISDSAQKVQAFSVLLQRAGAFFDAYEEDNVDNPVQKEDNSVETPVGIDLFSQEYPGARWRYVEGTDVLPHYEGTWTQPNGQTLHILAVRGHAAPRPPRALMGFTRYLRDRDGTGYWLRLTPLP